MEAAPPAPPPVLGPAPEKSTAEAGPPGAPSPPQPAEGTEQLLRGYQKELLGMCKARNSIVIAPTGCGKTNVALALAEHFLQDRPPRSRPPAPAAGVGAWDRPPKRFVVFLAKTRPLIQQQGDVFEDSPRRLRVTRVSGGVKCGSWRDMYHRNDVVVCIDSIFLHALQVAAARPVPLCPGGMARAPFNSSAPLGVGGGGGAAPPPPP